MLGALDARDLAMYQGLMLAGVEVAPGSSGMIVPRTGRLAALRTGQARVTAMRDRYVQLGCLRLETDLRGGPRLLLAENLAIQFCWFHAPNSQNLEVAQSVY